MPKDLLQALKASRGENEFVLGMHEMAGDSSVASNYMAKFFREVEEVRSSIDRIHNLVEQVKVKHSDVLSSPTQDDVSKRQLEEYMADIKRLANSIRIKLKEIEKSMASESEEVKNSAEYRIRQTQHSTLSRRFVDVMTEYNACQIEFRQRCKERIVRQLECADREISDDKLEDMLESGNTAIFTREIMAETQEAQRSLRDIEARHEDILKLERSIRELHELFMDMAILVETQGEMVDRIEFNVEKTVDHVQKAREQTTQAVKYQSRARRKKIICIVIVVVVVLVIILIIGLSVGIPLASKK